MSEIRQWHIQETKWRLQTGQDCSSRTHKTCKGGGATAHLTPTSGKNARGHLHPPGNKRADFKLRHSHCVAPSDSSMLHSGHVGIKSVRKSWGGGGWLSVCLLCGCEAGSILTPQSWILLITTVLLGQTCFWTGFTWEEKRVCSGLNGLWRPWSSSLV